MVLLEIFTGSYKILRNLGLFQSEVLQMHMSPCTRTAGVGQKLAFLQARTAMVWTALV